VTLILGMVGPQYAVLVSDRRITWMNATTGQPEKALDSDVKTFNFAGSSLVGFTGVARLEGLRMEAWLQDALDGVPPQDYRKATMAKIAAVFKKEGLEHVPHAFLGVCFMGYNGMKKVPGWWIISNAIDDQGNFSPSFLSSTWQSRFRAMRPGEHALRTVGYPIPAALKAEAEHLVTEAMRRDKGNPVPVVNLLVELTHQVSLKSGGLVGSSVLISTLPRSAVPALYASIRLGGSISDSEWRGTPIGLSYSRNFVGQGETRSYAPAIISPEVRLMGFQAELGRTTEFGPQDGFIKKP
jgi:hypothetical protein